MKTPGRFHRVVTFTFAAVFAAVVTRADTYFWNAKSGDWSTPGNWTVGEERTPATSAPGTEDDVFILAESGTITVTYKEAITVKSLEIGGADGTAVLSSETVEPFQVTGDCTILTNGKVTHKAGDTKEPYKVVLMVGGDMTITEGGKVDVSGCGGSGAGRSTDNPYGYEVAAHGGEAADHRLNTRLCYGSVRYPFNYGSQGGYANGGGAAMLSVAGALRVDGSILAEPSTNSSRNGSGGSIWIEAGELLGGGVISAQALATSQGCGGGGRIAVKLTNAGADFSAPVWTGTITACGNAIDTKNGNTAAGTVYQQTGDQLDGFGTLYIDNGGLANNAGYTEFNGRVTDTVVGDVVIRGGARFRIWDDGELTVRGSIVNEGTFVCKAGGSVTLDSAQDCLLKGGTFSISRLYCKVPGKTVKIADGTSLAIQNGGSLVLNGSAASPLTVIPENGASNWSLTLGSGVEQDVQYVAVKNAQASADVADFGGTDLTGNNDKWTFPEPVTPGATVIWTGATDTDWFKAGNWSPGHVPVKTDVVRISLAANGVYPICTQGKFTVNAIVVDAGATLTFAGTLPTVTNRLEVSGALVAKDGQEIVCLGDIDFRPGAAVDAPSATLRLTGPRARTLSFGDQSVYKVVAESDCGDITFATDFAATIFRNIPDWPARTLSFAPGTTCSVAGFIADGGAVGLTLASTAAGQAWTLSPKCFLYVNNATATDCGRTLENSGFVWNGGTGNFNAASGWSGNAVPGENDCAFIPSGAVTLNDERTVGTVVVGGFGSSAAFTVPVEATAKYHLMLLEGSTATCDQRFTIGGDVLVDSGATVTHQSGGSAEPYKVDFDVSGSMTVAAGGKIDVSAKGSNGSGYTTGDSGVGTGGYGGEPYNNRSRVCYGSVRQPFNYGSSGQNGPAGGAAKLVVAGELAVYGQVLSWPVDNQRNGSGGSIWLTAGTFRGDGIISANARKGTGDQQFCGAGGRVAVKLTEPGATFAAWTGKITAYGAKYNGNYYASCGTVYEQTGDQQDGYGTLYVDGGGLTALANQYGYVDFNDKVTDADVGDVVIRGNGRLRISDGGVLTVRGSISIDPSHGTFTSEPGGELVLDSTNDCVVSGGTLTLSTLRCNAAGKTVRMATGAALKVLDGGIIDLTGSKTEPLTLVPVEAASTWNFTLGAGVTKTVEYVAVSNSTANVDITDVGGTDLGGNSATWSFVPAIEPGEVITWTGAAGTTVWEAKDNWDLGRAPVESDVAVIAVTGGGNYPVLEQGEFAINTIRIDSGATLTFAGTLPTVTNLLEVSGTFVVRGAQDIRCQGDVEFKAGATVKAPSAVFRLTGPRARTLSFGDQSVYKVVTAADCGDVAFAAGLAAELVRNIPGEAARTLSFAPGTTCAVTGFIADGGAVGLTLASTAAGQAWTLAPKCFLYVSNATATDCGRTLENSGFVWKGGTGNFNAASGWSGNAVPGGDDCAFIPSGTVTLNDERTVGTVVVGGLGSSAAFKVPVEATARHHLMLLEGATATCDKHFTIGGDVLVDSRATVTHQSGGSTEPYKVDFDVAGSMTVAAAGKVDVSGCGGSGKGYSSDSPYGYDVAAYGGEAANHRVDTRLCYGSVRKPFNYGTSGNYCKGGGAAKVFVAGALTVNGSILAEPSTSSSRNGSGGSVWIEAGELKGSGVISAQALPSGQGCGGGGRVAVKLTKKGAGFTTDWTGTITASGSLPLSSAAGTVYEQTGDQQDGFGTLYVDNFGLANTAGYTEFNGRVTETDVGDVVIRGGARFRIFDDGALTVRGSIVNEGTFTCNSGAAVTLDSTNDCNISGGALTLSTLRCRVPGKTVRVAAGTTLNILAGGTLDLMGSKQEPLTLVPAEAASTWNLTLGAGVAQSVEYVAVSNSTANVDITDVGGTDLGGNSEQWTFIAPIEPGTVITWTGAAGTSDWTAKGNWDRGRAPVETDVAVIDVTQGGNYPVLEMGEFSVNTIKVEEGASLTFAGALPTVTNLLEVTGTLVVKERQKIFCRGDLVFKPGATYVSEGSAATFVLTGAGAKHVTLNGQRLHRVLIEADAGDVAFTDSAAVRLLRNVPGTAARTIALAANSTLTTDGLVADGGAVGLTLTGESWHLAAKYFVYAKNATASGCDRTLVTSGFVWDGGTANFNVPGNWGGTVPGADDCAFVPSGKVTVSAGQTVGTLVVGGLGSSAAVTVSAPLTVADDFCLADGATVTSDKPVTVGGDFVVYDDATVKQSAGTYMEYAVSGQAEVCYAGQIDGRGAGNVTTGRANSNGQTVAGYGGLGVYSKGIVTAWKCYGSIANPTNLGTAGNYANGGGRLRLVAKGELRVDGTISCNPTLGVVNERAGSGGSVWITCAKLTGTGRIEADGEDGQFGEGGGRLAIEQKAAANFSAFKGVAEARDRSSRGGAGTVCLTGAGADPQVVIADVLTGTSMVQTYTQLPGCTGADTPKQLKKMGFVVRDGARVRLMADMTIRDLDLQTKNVELDLNGHTLTILSQRHKRGLGWATGATVTSMENIVWRPGGFVISIR